MATYKEIKGVTVQALDEDPITNVGSWASGGSMNTPGSRQGTGTQTAAIVFGGQTPPAVTANAETYDGSSFTEVGDLNTARGQLGAFGTQPASFAAGGYVGPPGITDAVESWNGWSWTETKEVIA